MGKKFVFVLVGKKFETTQTKGHVNVGLVRDHPAVKKCSGLVAQVYKLLSVNLNS